MKAKTCWIYFPLFELQLSHFCLKIFFFAAILLFAASQHNLLAPATMETTFHQFGNYSILINKIFPMELGLMWYYSSSTVFYYSGFNDVASFKLQSSEK